MTADKQEIRATLEKYLDWKIALIIGLFVSVIINSPIKRNENIYLIRSDRFGENFSQLEDSFLEREMLLVEQKSFSKEEYTDSKWNRVFVIPALTINENVAKKVTKLESETEFVIETLRKLNCGYSEIEREGAAKDRNYFLVLNNESKSKLAECINSLKFDGRRWSILGLRII